MKSGPKSERKTSPVELSQDQELAAAIRELRKESRLTQVQFANELGITPTSVYRYEAGTNTPTNEILAKLLQYAVNRELLGVVQSFTEVLSKRTGLALDREALGPQSPLAIAITRLPLEKRLLVIAVVKMLKDTSDERDYRLLELLLEPWIEKAKQEFGSPELAFSSLDATTSLLHTERDAIKPHGFPPTPKRK